jgi:hypothetical protein
MTKVVDRPFHPAKLNKTTNADILLREGSDFHSEEAGLNPTIRSIDFGEMDADRTLTEEERVKFFTPRKVRFAHARYRTPSNLHAFQDNS